VAVTKNKLKRLGYLVEEDTGCLSMWSLVLSWESIEIPPEQVDIYLFNSDTEQSVDDLKFAMYLGTILPQKGEADTFVIRLEQSLARYGRVVLNPGMQGLIKTEFIRHKIKRYQLTLPKIKGEKDIVLSAYSTEPEAWSKASEIEELGGFENYLDAIDRHETYY